MPFFNKIMKPFEILGSVILKTFYLSTFTDCNCDISASIAAGALTIGGAAAKIRPVSRTYSAPLPLTNPAFFQPQGNLLKSIDNKTIST